MKHLWRVLNDLQSVLELVEERRVHSAGASVIRQTRRVSTEEYNTLSLKRSTFVIEA